MIDTKQQKIERTQEDMFHHLENNKLKPKFSIGVWYFFPGGGRFHESYIRKESIEVVINKIKAMKDSGIVDSGFGVEAHYPNEINYENIDLYTDLKKETGIKLITCIPLLFWDKQFEFGSLSNPNLEIRKSALDRLKETLRLNKELDTEICVIWPGIDGYENPFGYDFYGMWRRFEAGITEAMDEVPGVKIALEPKPYEPRGNNIYRNTANGLIMARNVESQLRSKDNIKTLDKGDTLVGLNPEVGHVLMGHEELAGSFASILREGRLFHTHWNSNPLGNYDQDLNAGVLGIDQMISTLLVCKMYSYQGYFGIDINPERMPIETAIQLNLRALRSAMAIVNLIDNERLVKTIYDPIGNRGVAEEVLWDAIESLKRN